jgi:predicted permease
MGGQPITPNTSMILEGKSVQVLGVTPPSFFGLVVGDRFDLAFPMCNPSNPPREVFAFTPSWDGSSRDGPSTRASAYFGALSAGIFESTAPTGYRAEAVKTYKSFRLAAYPAGSGVSVLREAYDSSLQLLLAITGLVLLIACANLANLMLARVSTRQREMAIRMALGASRARLLRQMLIESGLLALTGAGLGVALAQPLSRLLVASLNTSQGSIQLTIATDWRVLLFAAAVAVLTCIVFGTIPALRGTKADPNTALKSGARGVVGSRELFSVQRFMVVTQIAVSMVLLVGALLFVRSYRNLLTSTPACARAASQLLSSGFRIRRSNPRMRRSSSGSSSKTVRGIPGIQNAASTTQTPLGGGSWGHHIQIGDKDGDSRFTYASPTYFATMGIPLLSGRNFTDADTNDAPLVLIVNQAFIRKYLGSTPPIGQTVHVMPEPALSRAHISDRRDDSRHQVQQSARRHAAHGVCARRPVAGDREGSGSCHDDRVQHRAIHNTAVQHAIEIKYPNAVLQFFDFQQNIRDNLVGDRMMAMLSGFFGVLAALLVVVGLYGVLSFFITQRRNEIGVRIALGARRWQVIGLVMRDTAAMLLVGVVFGTILALLAGRTASAMLFGLKPYDLATLAFAHLIGVRLITEEQMAQLSFCAISEADSRVRFSVNLRNFRLSDLDRATGGRAAFFRWSESRPGPSLPCVRPRRWRRGVRAGGG